MSDVVDLPLVMLQKAQHAAEAAATLAKLFESEAGHRLTSIEARLVGIEVRLTGLEGRMSQLAAGQTGHELAIMRIADTQSEHTATLARIEAAIAAIAAKLP